MYQANVTKYQMHCGPSCLKIIAAFYGKNYSLDYLYRLCATAEKGASLLDVSKAAEVIGFNVMAVSTTLDKLISNAPLPFIAYFNHKHYVVVNKIEKESFYMSDPTLGESQCSIGAFSSMWLAESAGKGIALFLEPNAL